jgi:glycosyltransferase involved in cell wall biosynthesis
MGAYACEPQQGSEPAVGWHWAHEAANAGHEVWVVTRANNREPIEAQLDGAGNPALHFEYIDLPKPFRWVKQRLGHIGLLAYYYAWQFVLARRVRRLHQRVHFDLAHHVTFVNDTLPSGLAFLRIPFVWGPVGGSTHRLPPGIPLDLPRAARFHEWIRVVLQRYLKHVDPFTRLTRKRATVILGYTRESLAGLPAGDRPRARPVVHIGVSDTEPPPRPAAGAADPRPGVRVLTGGRLSHWKGYDLLIEGFAAFIRTRPDVGSALVITGAGTFRPQLECLARELGIDDRVAFVGRLPTRDAVFRLMHDSDLFALPTLRDGPPFVLLEAMAVGLPVLCLDLGATAELVPDGAGFKIAPRDRAFVIASIAASLDALAADPQRGTCMGRVARAHALREHAWPRIRAEIEQAYADAMRLRARG